jgi:ABC-type transport system involved in Fe-S cluster assembly fused permease/ATPase subunit
MFVIAHGLSTVASAEQILVMESGTIVERGTHEELLRKEGKYYALWMRQALPVSAMQDKSALRLEAV